MKNMILAAAATVALVLSVGQSFANNSGDSSHDIAQPAYTQGAGGAFPGGVVHHFYRR